MRVGLVPERVGSETARFCSVQPLLAKLGTSEVPAVLQRRAAVPLCASARSGRLELELPWLPGVGAAPSCGVRSRAEPSPLPSGSGAAFHCLGGFMSPEGVLSVARNGWRRVQVFAVASANLLLLLGGVHLGHELFSHPRGIAPLTRVGLPRV